MPCAHSASFMRRSATSKWTLPGAALPARCRRSSGPQHFPWIASARVSKHTSEADLLGRRRPLLEAYAAGANAGLNALSVRPWPYLLLRKRPAEWTAEDTVLAAHALYFDLQGYHPFARLALWRLSLSLPAPLFAMLNHGGTSWDAPLVGEGLGDAPLPGADAIDLSRLPPINKSGAVTANESAPGSNNLAVAGALTKDGRAIVGGDMHLGLRSPGVWFRARLIYRDERAPGGRIDVTGFTFPGIPGVIAGSTGHVAWAVTNGYADASQWALMPPCTGAPTQCGITEHRGARGARRPRDRLGTNSAPAAGWKLAGTAVGSAPFGGHRQRPCGIRMGVQSR